MEERTKIVLALRPNIECIKHDLQTGDIEAFQNNTIRPILKFQNTLLIELFLGYCRQYKGAFFKLNMPNQLDYISHSIRTNKNFRSMLIGTIVALFTSEELLVYKQNTSAFNKRIVNMLIQRLQDQAHSL